VAQHSLDGVDIGNIGEHPGRGGVPQNLLDPQWVGDFLDQVVGGEGVAQQVRVEPGHPDGQTKT
jgi:hypothetical protein